MHIYLCVNCAGSAMRHKRCFDEGRVKGFFGEGIAKDGRLSDVIWIGIMLYRHKSGWCAYMSTTIPR